jgi:hypothetical protein
MHRSLFAGLALTGLMLAGCSREPVGTNAPDLSVGAGETFTLQVGQIAELTGVALRIRLLEVAQDSRCPRDVVCVWEGDALAAIEVVYRGVEYAFGLHLNPAESRPGTATVGGYQVALDAVAPEPQADVTIPQADYRVTFRIHPAPSP